MTTIGVYDSGIGGLTTLKLLKTEFPYCDFYYLADNLNMPFGTKSAEQLEEIVFSATKKLKAHSEIQVFACNTASTFAGDDVIKLIPPATTNGKSLVMATPATIERIKADFQDPRYVFADTPELASLVEVYAAVGARKNCLNMKELLPYLAGKLFEFRGVENVVLGCSHYLYLKNEISTVLKRVNFVDGNDKIIKALTRQIEKTDGRGKITFGFTADDENAKYQKIFSLISGV